MALEEVIDIKSEAYKKVEILSDIDDPLMKTRPGEKLDLEVFEAYARLVTKGPKKGMVVILLVPKVQFGRYFGTDKAALAGEYVINEVKGRDANSDDALVQHFQIISLDQMNHIVDLNRPDTLVPERIYENDSHFKEVAQKWLDHGFITKQQNEQIQALPDGRADLIDPNLSNLVLKNANFNNELAKWRNDTWISEAKAKAYAKSGKALFTLDDELVFQAELF